MTESVLLLGIQQAIVSVFVFKLIAVLCSVFMAITFCQSALDKITDYQGNRAYFQTQFEKSILRNMIGFLLPLLTLMEAATGLLCIFGNVWRLFTDDWIFIFLGLLTASIALLSLLFGQRVAKDYVGASSLTGYFIVAVLGLLGIAGTA